MATTLMSQRGRNTAALLELAESRIKEGFAPPREIYLAQNRNDIDWSKVPDWARFVDPDCYEGCCHEG